MSSGKSAHEPVSPRCWLCRFTGHVQGVGFRYTAQSIAQRYRVSGYVRNTVDGRVELVIEGEESELHAFLGELKRQMRGYIEKVDQEEQAARGQFHGFTITR